MRLLFAFAGGTGHFLPLVPIARAAAAAGHEVAFAAQRPMLARVEASGFRAHDAGGETLRSGPRRLPLVAPDPEHEARVLRETFAGRVARERAAAIGGLLDEVGADLVVCDELDFGAKVAAERHGVPLAVVLCSASAAFAAPGVVAEPLAELRSAFGLAPEPPEPLVFSPFPPSLREPGAAHAIRPAGPEPDAPAPPWLAGLSGPVVHVTLGTVFNQESGDLLERLLEGMAQLPVQVVATVGHELDPGALGPQPANVRVEQWVDQFLLLPRCAAVVCHGGSGSIVGALAHGLPAALVPLGADQLLNAARCEEIGVARVLDPVSVRPEEAAAAVAALLGDGPHRRSAERVRDEIAALPGPEHALALLEQLTR